MQDIHSIAGGGGGRIFGSTGDRRLRPHHHHHHGHHNHHQAALKCPRCDSLNTKFCYYNNYNLSQPRHFCKSCRRYWTKGGVLRNVPVGGGCRKSKRSSKPKPSPPSLEPQPAATATATASATANQPRERKSSSHSSSESSSLTATTTAIATEAVSATSSISQSNNLLSIQDYSNSIMSQGIIINPNEDSGYEKRLMEQTATECGLFTDIGSFSTLISSSSVDAQLSLYGFNAVLSQPTHQGQVPHDTTNTNDHHHQWPHQMASLGGFNMEHHHHHHHHHNVLVDLPSSQNDDSAHRSSAGGFGSLDWQTNGDEQGLFDIPNAVDQGYWGQHQWSHDAEDQDQPGLYLP